MFAGRRASAFLASRTEFRHAGSALEIEPAAPCDYTETSADKVYSILKWPPTLNRQ
jgi:hypothetical protein